MMRPLAGLFACAVAAAVSAVAPNAAPGRQDAQLPTFRSGADAVAVDVSVMGRNRRPITGLTAGDFEVYDNDVLQQVEDVTYGKLPIDIAVALDVSYSVTGRLLQELQRAVGQLVRDLGPDDRLKLVLVNARVSRVVDYSRDIKAVERAIQGVAAGGGTSLFDALAVTLVSANTPERRQLIVVFTDGSDSTSTTSEAMLREIALRTRATLAFVIPVRGPRVAMDWRTSGVRRAGRVTVSAATLESLARDTGGSVLPVAPGTNLTSAFRRVLDEFRSAYVLHYTARDVESGGFHAIRVVVDRPGAEVLARRGYFGS